LWKKGEELNESIRDESKRVEREKMLEVLEFSLFFRKYMSTFIETGRWIEFELILHEGMQNVSSVGFIDSGSESSK
jgi:hypothetical protein